MLKRLGYFGFGLASYLIFLGTFLYFVASSGASASPIASTGR